MRYSYTALVLATAAISQVAAGPVAHNHAHFHAKKNAEALDVAATEEKRGIWNGINFDTVAISYSVGQTWGEPTSAPAVVAAVATSAPTATATSAAATTTAPSVADTVESAVSGAVDSAVDFLGDVISSTSLSKILAMGIKSAGTNSLKDNGNVWIGSDGPYTNTFVNESDEEIVVVVWGPWASWVNVQVPHITHTLPAGSKFTASFANGAIGGWAAIYDETLLSNGQIKNTWGEFTMGPMGVVDVSREVNMNGRGMSIVGPTCTSDMDTCVFVCSSGDVCTTGYELRNCEPGSQPNANYGIADGAPSGGCGGLGNSAALTTTFT